MRGKIKKISVPRRLIGDMMCASIGVPFVTLRRKLDIGELLEARSKLAQPPGWAAIFVKAFQHYSQHEIDGVPVNYAAPVFGIEVPIVIGIGSLILALVLALALGPVFRPFFDRRPEVLQLDNPEELS